MNFRGQSSLMDVSVLKLIHLTNSKQFCVRFLHNTMPFCARFRQTECCSDRIFCRSLLNYVRETNGLTDNFVFVRSPPASLKESLNNEEDFRSFYMFAFDYNKPENSRSLPIEMARQLFPLILEGRFVHLELWIEFLGKRKQAISRDTYSLLLDFARNIDYDLKNFDEENGAWPVLLDEFVDFAKPRVTQGKDRMNE